MKRSGLTSLIQAIRLRFPRRARRSCAWCLVEQGRDLGSGSHGICQRHAISTLAAYRERRNRREVQA